MKLSYTCQKCDHEFDVDVSPIIPAKIYGPPEDCHPEEGGEIDPDECPKCDAKVDEETVWDRANEITERCDED
jgi:DNA-directed RNA polymerase subunit RPC12/RpoP